MPIRCFQKIRIALSWTLPLTLGLRHNKGLSVALSMSGSPQAWRCVWMTLRMTVWMSLMPFMLLLSALQYLSSWSATVCLSVVTLRSFNSALVMYQCCGVNIQCQGFILTVSVQQLARDRFHWVLSILLKRAYYAKNQFTRGLNTVVWQCNPLLMMHLSFLFILFIIYIILFILYILYYLFIFIFYTIA